MTHSHLTYEKRVVGKGYKLTRQIHVEHWQVIGKTQKELFCVRARVLVGETNDDSPGAVETVSQYNNVTAAFRRIKSQATCSTTLFNS